jgi:hypothetical protein
LWGSRSGVGDARSDGEWRAECGAGGQSGQFNGEGADAALREEYGGRGGGHASGEICIQASPEMNSYGNLVLHIAETNNFLCAKASAATAPEVTLKETDAKDKLVAALKASFDFCSTALANVDDSKLSDPLTLFGNRPSSRAGALIVLSDEWFDHYSTQAVYLRLNGILPPSAQPPATQPAAAQPPKP